MRNMPAETDNETGTGDRAKEVEDVNLSHFLQAFFDQVPAILYIKDEAGRYVKINPHCERIFHVSDAEARGQTDDKFFPPEMCAQFQANDRIILETGEPQTFEETAVIGDEVHTYLARKFRVSDERNGRHYVCGISTDVTSLKNSENKLAAATAEAERASRAKSQFLAAISHDMRQPIQAASLFLGVLDGRIADPKAREVLERVRSSIDAVHGMLGDLLDLSRLDAELIEPTPRPVPVGEILSRLHAEFAPQAELKGITLRTVPCATNVATDPDLLIRILRNLLANAVTHTASGRILLGCRRRGALLRVEVADTGAGIPEEQQHRIFEEFYQIGNPERDRSRGFGLGLAIVSRIARMLGHPVALRSTVGKGSVFSVTIPVAASVPEPGPQLQSRDDADAGTLACRPVLLIEDDPAVMGALEMLLEEWGLPVVTAQTIEELADSLGRLETVPALIIADYRLPGCSTGADAVALARSRVSPDLPAIIMTGDTAPERLREARANGSHLLHKPVQADQLRHVVGAILGRQAAPEARLEAEGREQGFARLDDAGEDRGGNEHRRDAQAEPGHQHHAVAFRQSQ